MAVFAQDEFEIIEAPDLYKRDICTWPMQGFTELLYRTAEVSTACAGERPYTLSFSTLECKEEKKDQPINWSLLENNMISTRKEFRPFRKQIDLDIDWRKEKISFYTNSTTYKFGMLESDYLLTGISISEDGKTLCLGYQSTFHGVCQGIAQQTEWFSHASSTFAVVIPKTVERIISTSCYYGPDCSEIP